MRRALFRRTAVAVASVASLTLLVGACGADKPADTPAKGGGKAASDAPAKGGDPAGSAGSSAKALTAAELEKVALAEGDVTTHMIAPGKKADEVPAGSIKVDKPECTPLADAMVGVAVGKPGASVLRKAIEKPAKMKVDPKASDEEKFKAGMGALTQPVTVERLASYDGTGAQEAFAALDKAGKACAGGFGGQQGGDKVNIAKVTPDAVTGGDEAAGWTFDMKGQGPDEMDVVMKLAAVRKGGTVATFYTFSLGGTVKAQPVPVIGAQLKKLG
ncbi:hypothetical protein OG897_25495 [Streptomyces sp. NBC_00237]|uniref:hypothetical protein n=1 Tax=Streptomyces sp. NBC_00237 TaxID=2975687 RepID=UPI002251A9C9|nr:hypothetical protein [Streptomyces sp. NBC_00237]MCX5204798.1 hypothetical protein [Streptomyces sp. NBC_00237]